MSVAARPEPPPPLAVYRRTVAASLTRIWENVLDWEHLPWLHRGAFLSVRLLDSWRDGWRAEVALPPPSAPRTAEIAVHLDRLALRYVTATVAGFGAGTEILTALVPEGAHATAITVTFHVPDVDPARREMVAAAYTRLYARLWDEDEAMMVRRHAVLDAEAAPGDDAGRDATLGHEDEVRARLPFVVKLGAREVRLVALGDAIVAHATVCPHRGGPLAAAPVENGAVTCPWHGYRFDLRTGANTNRRSCRLDPPAHVTIDPSTRIVTVTTPRPG